ncbi:hypothetical protein KG892_03385 [Vermiphilus pyriformis]|uniref:Uncharacterized protein n=1 Tax=candidate division TM6 bacterium JCVI TM6SC1 TaxID=1306947 RepID=A0A0D2JDB2_9BACT|nr:hypothetical protein J120_04430 [candidate division TM6 bacterium JCVI TM6SC1]UNE35016.1 MAG: hypothetical protein KG892_03385 [Vermiphilus pyriformis]
MNFNARHVYTLAALACISSNIHAMEKEATSNKTIQIEAYSWDNQHTVNGGNYIIDNLYYLSHIEQYAPLPENYEGHFVERSGSVKEDHESKLGNEHQCLAKSGGVINKLLCYLKLKQD